MIGWLAACAAIFTAGGIAGGVYLACRFTWPRKVYEMLFAARP